ncbi:hypothetical protein BT69DRAFT_949730 [Atractiella rhizophila]|nr:hypothetical protein BT69DRAFT_949730 [Atractiella rhizophila]
MLMSISHSWLFVCHTLMGVYSPLSIVNCRYPTSVCGIWPFSVPSTMSRVPHLQQVVCNAIHRRFWEIRLLPAVHFSIFTK